jgi:hypothetical protein
MRPGNQAPNGPLGGSQDNVNWRCREAAWEKGRLLQPQCRAVLSSTAPSSHWLTDAIALRQAGCLVQPMAVPGRPLAILKAGKRKALTNFRSLRSVVYCTYGLFRMGQNTSGKCGNGHDPAKPSTGRSMLLTTAISRAAFR